MKLFECDEVIIGGSVGAYGNKHVQIGDRSLICRKVFLDGSSIQFSSPIEDVYVIHDGNIVHVYHELPPEIPDVEDKSLKVNAGAERRKEQEMLLNEMHSDNSRDSRYRV